MGDDAAAVVFRGGPLDGQMHHVPRPAPYDVRMICGGIDLPQHWAAVLTLHRSTAYLHYRLVGGPDLHYAYLGQATPPAKEARR
jgi:hypothetical protein